MKLSKIAATAAMTGAVGSAALGIGAGLAQAEPNSPNVPGPNPGPNVPAQNDQGQIPGQNGQVQPVQNGPGQVPGQNGQGQPVQNGPGQVPGQNGQGQPVQNGPGQVPGQNGQGQPPGPGQLPAQPICNGGPGVNCNGPGTPLPPGQRGTPPPGHYNEPTNYGLPATMDYNGQQLPLVYNPDVDGGQWGVQTSNGFQVYRPAGGANGGVNDAGNAGTPGT